MVAAGKAAAAMAAAFLEACGRTRAKVALAVGPQATGEPPAGLEWVAGGHPLPDAGSETAGRRALAIARAVPPDGTLVLLLSGGASALMALPLDGLTLADKRQTAAQLMAAGADITALNTVRKHLSAIKGGRLAAACRGATLTLAVSDVVGDDPSVIGSGPGVGDATTWADVLAALERHGGVGAYPPAVVAACREGVEGRRDDTPAPGDARLARARALVIGGAADALEGAREAAARLGYHTIVLAAPVVGEAREAAPAWLGRSAQALAAAPRPACVLSAGETTVRVRGSGLGGRNQEFVVALAPLVGRLGGAVVAASVGTDGVDGPTPAAGGLVDATTLARAAALGLPPPRAVLDANDSHTFLAALDGLVVTGPTGTNVGDLQVLLVG